MGEQKWLERASTCHLFDSSIHLDLCSCSNCDLLMCCKQIRNSIKALFPDRDCYTLVRPMFDERQLNHLDELPPEDLRPEFRQVRPFIRLVKCFRVCAHQDTLRGCKYHFA